MEEAQAARAGCMSLGFGFTTDFGKPTFSLFEVGFHAHPRGYTDCKMLFGLTLCLLGVHLIIGLVTD